MEREVPVDEMRFGEALAELEAIVEALEGGRLDLEESMERYERGVALLKACKARLDEAEQKVTMLMGELGGEDECEDTAGD